MSGVVVWLTGLPSSGKSTLASEVQAALRASGEVGACRLDGDDVRADLVPPPGYDEAARDGFYATLANLAARLAAQDLVVLVAATAHRSAFRERARALAPRFVEVHVDTPAETCAARDPKGLWARAAGDGATALPGVGPAYEPPSAPEVVVRPADADRVARVLAAIRAARA